MKHSIKGHFLSVKDKLRFSLFVGFSGILLAIGMLNRTRPYAVWPQGNRLIDSKPRQMVSPIIHREFSQISLRNKA